MPILVLLVLHLISREMKECRKGGPLIPFLGGVRQREDKLRRNGNCGFVIGGDLDEGKKGKEKSEKRIEKEEEGLTGKGSGQTDCC